MNDFLDSLICRQTFDTQAMMNSHPPKFYHPNKKLVYDICCPPGCTHRGQLAFSRWYAMPLPEYLSPLEHQTDLSDRLSQVNCLVFHTSDAMGSQNLATAQQIVDRDLAKQTGIPTV
jgi:hypothetical protein